MLAGVSTRPLTSKFHYKHTDLTISDFKLVDGDRMYKFVWKEDEMIHFRWENINKIDAISLQQLVHEYELQHKEYIRDAEEMWQQLMIEGVVTKPYVYYRQQKMPLQMSIEDENDSDYDEDKERKKKRQKKKEEDAKEMKKMGRKGRKIGRKYQRRSTIDERPKEERKRLISKYKLLKQLAKNQQYFTAKLPSTPCQQPHSESHKQDPSPSPSPSLSPSPSSSQSNQGEPNTLNLASCTSDFKPIIITLQQFPQQKINQIEQYYKHHKYQPQIDQYSPEPYQPSVVSQAPQNVFTSEQQIQYEQSHQLESVSLDINEEVTDIRQFVIKQLKQLNIYERVQLNEQIIGSYCKYNQKQWKDKENKKDKEKMYFIQDQQKQQNKQQKQQNHYKLQKQQYEQILKESKYRPIATISQKQQNKRLRKQLSQQYYLQYVQEHYLPGQLFKVQIRRPTIAKINYKIELPSATLYAVRFDSIYSCRQHFVDAAIISQYYPQQLS